MPTDAGKQMWGMGTERAEGADGLGSLLLKRGFCGPDHILSKPVAEMAQTARIEK